MFNKDIDRLHKPEIDSSQLTEIFLQGLCHEIFTSCCFYFLQAASIEIPNADFSIISDNFKQFACNITSCRKFPHYFGMESHKETGAKFDANEKNKKKRELKNRMTPSLFNYRT